MYIFSLPTAINIEKKFIVGILIDRCQWHVALSADCLFDCPPLLSRIESICEVLQLKDIFPLGVHQQSPLTPVDLSIPSGCNSAVQHMTEMSTVSHSSVQFASQLKFPCTCRPFPVILVNYNQSGFWSKLSVLNINELLIGSYLVGKVERRMNSVPQFHPEHPRDPSRSLSEVLSMEGIAGSSSSAEYLQKSPAPAIVCPPEQLGVSRGFARRPFLANVTEACEVTAVETGPWKFSIQLVSQSREFKNLRSLLSSFRMQQTVPPEHLKVGACVICRRQKDNLIHRALVTHPPRGGNVQVFFVDIGESEVVPLSCVYPPTPDLLKIPILSQRCKLDNLPDAPDVSISTMFQKIVNSRDYTLSATFVTSNEQHSLSCVSLTAFHYPSRLAYPLLDIISLPQYPQERLVDEAKVLGAHHDGTTNVVYFHLQQNCDKVKAVFNFFGNFFDRTLFATRIALCLRIF